LYRRFSNRAMVIVPQVGAHRLGIALRVFVRYLLGKLGGRRENRAC